MIIQGVQQDDDSRPVYDEELNTWVAPFFIRMAPITMPVFFAGILTCLAIEKFSIAGFGNQLPTNIRNIFNDYSIHMNEKNYVSWRNHSRSC